MENRILWISLLVTTLFLSADGIGAATESWIPAEQPELKQALEKAPLLETESLGTPSRGVNPWQRWVVPNPGGKTWDVLQFYMHYQGPIQLFIIDLGTGKVKKQPWPANHSPYGAAVNLAYDGKLYIITYTKGEPGGLWLFVYDPATNTVADRGQIIKQLQGELRPAVLGPDGRIYGSGSSDEGKVGLYIFDPKQGKVVKDFGLVGPQHTIGSTLARDIGVDDKYAYIVSGDIPSYLVAINIDTGAEKILFQTPQLSAPSGVRMAISEGYAGAYAVVPQFDGPSHREYWLYHGEAIPMAKSTAQGKETQKAVVPPQKPASPMDVAGPKPDLYFEQLEPDERGSATLWWRPYGGAARSGRAAAKRRPENLAWRAIKLEGIESYSHRIGPLALLPDGRLHGASDNYVGSFNFDPKSDTATLLGRNQGLAPYTYIVAGDRLYASGYPGGPVFAYDPKLPWTLHKGGPPDRPAPGADSPKSNSRRVGVLGATRVAIAHSSAVGFDGKVYFGGFGERSYTGGGFGSYDPKTGKTDGFWKPLSGYMVHYIAPLLGGRLIAISSTIAPDELKGGKAPGSARLFFYDVPQQKIVREVVPVAKARTTGLIAEASPGRLLGLTIEGAEYGRPCAGVLYGVDAATGDVLFRKSVPWPVGVDPYWPHWIDPSYEHLGLVRGPDGFLWTYLRDVLVRIDPKDANVHVVGKVAPVGYPTFVGNDLYLSGSEQLRRIGDAAKRSQAVQEQ